MPPHPGMGMGARKGAESVQRGALRHYGFVALKNVRASAACAS